MRSTMVSPSATRPAITRRPRRAGRSPSPARRQALDAVDDRGVAVDLDLRAQADQLLHVHEAVLEDRLGDAARCRRRSHSSAMNCACMSVGKRRVLAWCGSSTARGRAVDAHADASRRRPSIVAPASRSLSITASRMVGAGVRAADVAAGRRDRAQEGAGLDAVGHDPVRRAVQLVDALDRDAARCRGPRSCAPIAISISARSVTSGSLRRVLEHGLAFGQRGGHQQVLGAGDGDHVGADARALQALRRAASM